MYGPTESTTFASWHRVDGVAAEAMTVPIGRPISNTTTYVLGGLMAPVPVPVGVPGERHIGGDGAAPGYLNLPDLTVPGRSQHERERVHVGPRTAVQAALKHIRSDLLGIERGEL